MGTLKVSDNLVKFYSDAFQLIFFSVVRFLASMTDQPNIPDDEGDTPIHEAAKNGDIEGWLDILLR